MAQSDFQKAIDALVSIAGEISGKLDAIQQLLEEQQDGQTSRSGNAPQSAPAQAQGSQAGGVVAAVGESPSQRQASATRSAALGIGLDTLVGVSDPTQSKVIATAEGLKSLASFAVGAVAEKAGGTAGKEFAQAGLEAALNLSGVNQQLNTLKQAQGSLLSRVVGASDAGLIYSDQQLQEIAASEVGRFQERARQVNRAVAAFDKELVSQGLNKISGNLDSERNKVLKEIRQELKNQNQAKSLKGGNQ